MDIQAKMVRVEFLKDQSSPEFGERSKGDKPFMFADRAKILMDRGIIKIIEDFKEEKQKKKGVKDE